MLPPGALHPARRQIIINDDDFFEAQFLGANFQLILTPMAFLVVAHLMERRLASTLRN